LALSERDRADIFQLTADQYGTLGSYVEKDFWVCLVLNILFQGLPKDHPALSFKGGTSLSKVFELIQRFSEDIDITVSRADLGFDRDRDPADASLQLSSKKRTKLLKELRASVSDYTRDLLLPALVREICQFAAMTQIDPDPDDPDNATLLIQYPKLMSEGSPEYVRARVKIELGARAAQEPITAGTVLPYVSHQGLEMNLTVAGIRTVTAERTFWEKILILHGWQSRFRDTATSIVDRDLASRHYYDVAMISQSNVRDAAIADGALLARVREHNELMFPQAWKKYGEAQPGSFRLLPTGKLLDDIRRDYERMKGMIFGDAPAFNEVVNQIGQLEAILNAS
jgi:hypothetical protein